MSNVLDCSLEISEFKLQLRYYDHFYMIKKIIAKLHEKPNCFYPRTNTLWNGVKPRIPQAMGCTGPLA